MYMVCPIVGYLTEEGLHRTCASFREECSLFHNGNNNLDQVHTEEGFLGIFFLPP